MTEKSETDKGVSVEAYRRGHDYCARIGEGAPLPLISSLLQIYPAVLISAKGTVVDIVTKADLLNMLL
jgi:predicted transcriptional regulator